MLAQRPCDTWTGSTTAREYEERFAAYSKRGSAPSGRTFVLPWVRKAPQAPRPRTNPLHPETFDIFCANQMVEVPGEAVRRHRGVPPYCPRVATSGRKAMRAATRCEWVPSIVVTFSSLRPILISFTVGLHGAENLRRPTTASTTSEPIRKFGRECKLQVRAGFSYRRGVCSSMLSKR